ncbi:MAG: zinc metalloprotease HtpX [Betaproteobacteria bacterium]|nr:zinc metalloprotease HtpX [Betaproteobacteria bacterium]
MTSQVKTALLLALLSAIIISLGALMGGRTGIIVALGLAVIMNVGSYWYSDKIVLSMYRARPLDEYEAPALHRMVAELAQCASIPKPKICVIPEEAPNAFATGRDPEHGVVAVTEGIMRLLSPEELRGVLSHEIGHIANRDILIQTVAGVMASAIVSIANMMQFMAFFGGSRSNEEGGGSGNIVTVLLMAVLAPIAASIIQMAISRSREYLADATGASFCGQPLALAEALAKLQRANQRIPMQAGNAAVSGMFVVTPFSAGAAANLFSTHPPIEERIARLRAMAGLERPGRANT